MSLVVTFGFDSKRSLHLGLTQKGLFTSKYLKHAKRLQHSCSDFPTALVFSAPTAVVSSDRLR